MFLAFVVTQFLSRSSAGISRPVSKIVYIYIYVSPYHECIKGNRGIVLFILNLGIRWSSSGQIHAPP
jgi:hypothetical protein